jgi:hypothetical protein
MKVTKQIDHSPTAAPPTGRIDAGSWLLLTALMSLLVATLVIVYLGWTSAKDANVPTSAYVAMALGVTISLIVGFGLMALVFYSSRKGYDEPPVLVDSGAAVESNDAMVVDVADNHDGKRVERARRT